MLAMLVRNRVHPYQNIRPAGSAVASLIAYFVLVLGPFLILGELVQRLQDKGGLWFDAPLLYYIHGYAGPFTDFSVSRLTIIAGVLALPAFIVSIAVIRFLSRPREAVFFAASVSGAWALNVIAKVFFQRLRPSLWPSLVPEHDFSFPSGHAMCSMAFAAALVVFAWPTKLRWPAVVGAVPCVVLIGLSRLYLGVHYPSDIVAGWCGAVLWVMAVYRCAFVTSANKKSAESIRQFISKGIPV